MPSNSTIPPGQNTRLPGNTGMGEDPLYRALRTYTLGARGLFKARNIGDLRWSDDPAQSEIRITTRAPINVEDRQTPAIIVSRKHASTNITDKRVTSIIDNSKQHSSIVGSSMIMYCIAPLPSVASQMAWILFQNLPIIKAELQRWGQIFQISSNLQIGEESAPQGLVTGGSDQDWSMVPVISPFFVSTAAFASDSSSSGFHSVLREVTIALETGLGAIPNTGAIEGGPAIAMGRGGGSYNPPTYNGKPVTMVRALTHPSSVRAPLVQTSIDTES